MLIRNVNSCRDFLQLNGRHTTGSRSNAVVLDQMVFSDCRAIVVVVDL
jgi:hypothetical protein